MGMMMISFPRYIYQQPDAPTNAPTGAIWVDTDASPITTYVWNGSSWLSLTTDVDWVAGVLAQLSINVLINSVAASATLNDYEMIFVDDFTDADGTSNTIDTGNTTALFVTDKYINGNTAVTEDHGYASSGSDSVTAQSGVKVTMTANTTLTSVTRFNGGTADTCYLLDSSYVELANAAFSGDVATFNDYALLNGVSYVIVCKNSNNSSYTRHFNNASTPMDPDINGTNLVWNDGVNDVSLNANIYNVDLINLGKVPANRIVQTNAITIPSGITNHQLYCKNALAGSGAITYDISADGGSTWDTGQALNSKNSFGATTGTSCKIKINLNGTGAGNTAQADNYGVIIYT